MNEDEEEDDDGDDSWRKASPSQEVLDGMMTILGLVLHKKSLVYVVL